ncbi:MAG: hypothetical protein KBD00_00685 [Candidatus Peribacteraceae bacterium]|nr:hypothetical protein [Candidatus Peribacteraceae bacterium]
MIPHLPSSIESYLKDTGFTATEILVIKKLLEEDVLTVRELATKTVRSTGIIDQAIKKLAVKKIVSREMINGQPKYRILSLEAITHWLEQEKKSRQLVIERRHRDFETFLSTVQKDKSRPDMEYFEGEEGIRKAYMRLLEQDAEIVGFIPIAFKEEDDPLRTFRLEYFRQRRLRKVFLRQITTDTTLARRYQNRDAFEYRQTRLVPEEELYIPFEKFVVGDIVACIDHLIQRVCFIRYPEFAKAEKMAFEKLWSRSEKSVGSTEVVVAQVTNRHPISRKTKILSALRIFCMSKISLAVFLSIFILLGVFTYGLSEYTQLMNLQRVQDKIASIAATAALDVDPKDLAELQVQDDYKKPEWTKVVTQIKNVRLHNQHVYFVYIIRKSAKDPNSLLFVADSHSLNPFANTDNDPTNDVDANNDGTIDSVDYLQWPGQEYPNPPPGVMNGFIQPYATSSFYTDSWGTMITGYAPIKDGSGSTIAVLAVDFSAEDFKRLTQISLIPFIICGLFLALFLVARCIALQYKCSLRHRFRCSS